MKHEFKKYLLGLWLFLIAISSVANGFVDIPELKSRVTDLTNTLSTYDKNELESELEAFEKNKGSQVVVLIIPSTGDETIEQYSIRVAEKWKIGREGVDDGVILLVAKDDRKLRIEVGYGLEGAIPDVYSKRIIERIIVPNFRAGDFGNGIKEGVGAIIGLIDGEDLPEVTSSENTIYFNDDNFHLIPFFVPGIFVWIIILSALKVFVKNKKWLLLLIILGTILVYIIYYTVVANAAFVFCISYLIFSLGILYGKNKGGYYGGGGFGGYSGGGFGGGGFSGGGGSFGGGGSSGSW